MPTILGSPADPVMRQASFWLIAILFPACLGLTAEILRLRGELAIVRSEAFKSTVETGRQKIEIVDLRRKLMAKARAALASPGAAHAQSLRERHRLPPEIEAMVEREMRHQVTRLYGPGISALHLSSDKLAKLKSLLNEMALSQKDTSEALEAAGVGPDAPTFAKALNQTRSSVEDEVKALIGSDGWATLEASAQFASFDATVKNDYAYDFEDAGNPLSSSQELVLAQALASTRAPGSVAPGGAVYFKPDAVSGLSPANQAVLTSVAGCLSADQIRVLKNILQQGNRTFGSGTDLPGGTSVTIGIVTDESSEAESSADH